MNVDEEAVRAALTALDEAFERRDLRAALDLCTEDVVFIGSGDGEVAIGREQIGPMFAALAPQLEGMEFSLAWESVDVEVLGDIALLYAWGPATLVTSRRNASFRYRLTGVLVRDGERWLWRVHHGSEPGACVGPPLCWRRMEPAARGWPARLANAHRDWHCDHPFDSRFARVRPSRLTIPRPLVTTEERDR